MDWTKELPKDPGYYWILDRDEDGSDLVSIVEIVHMPEDKELIKELLEIDDQDEVATLMGKPVILTMGDSYIQLLDDPELEGLYWYGPITEPSAPSE